MLIIIHGKIKMDIIVVYNSNDELMKKLDLFYAALRGTLTVLVRFPNFPGPLLPDDAH